VISVWRSHKAKLLVFAECTVAEAEALVHFAHEFLPGETGDRRIHVQTIHTLVTVPVRSWDPDAGHVELLSVLAGSCRPIPE
jgi:hypothetical protein